MSAHNTALVMASKVELDFSFVAPDCRTDDEGGDMVWAFQRRVCDVDLDLRIYVAYKPVQDVPDTPWLMVIVWIDDVGDGRVFDMQRYRSADILQRARERIQLWSGVE